MRPLSFRQWVACTVIVAMLFNTAAPLGICWCEGCQCENNISRYLSKSKPVEEKCCCTPSVPQPDDGCCGLPETPCPCPCGDIQNDAAIPAAILPDKLPNLTPTWNGMSVAPIGFSSVSTVSSNVDRLRTLLPLHVPLHVLLCVFLN